MCSAKYGSSIVKVAECLKDMAGKEGSVLKGERERGGREREEEEGGGDEVDCLNLEVLSVCMNVIRELEDFRALLMHQSGTLSLSLSLCKCVVFVCLSVCLFVSLSLPFTVPHPRLSTFELFSFPISIKRE